MTGREVFGWCIDIKEGIVIWDDGCTHCYTSYREFLVLYATDKKEFMCNG